MEDSPARCKSSMDRGVTAGKAIWLPSAGVDAEAQNPSPIRVQWEKYELWTTG